MITPTLIMSTFPWLSTLLVLLGLGAILALASPLKWARWITISIQLIILVISIILVINFKTTISNFQYGEKLLWIPSLDIHYQLGVDGFSVLFLPFSAVLFIAVVMGTWNAIRTLPNAYFSLLLIMQLSLVGVFTALDTVLFFLFWELSVIPLFFLISFWGAGANRRYAGMKYALFMLVGGVPLLLGFLLLGINDSTGFTSDYFELLKTAHTQPHELLVFALLFIGFAVKMPVFPLHTWLPVIAQEGPAGIIAIVSGLKIGVYGLLRFAMPLVPDAAINFKWLLVGLGMLGLLYGAITALGQTNLRRMLAFSSVSHVGLVLLGIASLNPSGLQGTMLQLLNFALIAGGLYLLVEFIHQRTGSAEALSLGGIAGNMPVLVSLFFLLSMASIGIPGTSGFIAEFLLIVSTLKTYTGAGLVALFVVVLGAGYVLNSIRITLLGPAHHEYLTRLPDLLPRELVAISLLVIGVLVFGLYPQGILNLLALSSATWLGLVQ
jgi:NADH-quinone oxidoreductase subunit M